MRNLFYLLVFMFAITTVASCGRSEGDKALRKMEKIVVKAEKNKDNLSADEWKELAASFEENEKIANDAAEKNKLGVAGKMKFIALAARWANAYGPSMMMEEMAPKVNELLENLGSELEEITKSLSEDSIMQKALDEDTVK